MDLDELQSVQSRERQTDSLQQLRATFYQDAAEYIHALEAERDRAAEGADDPWNSPEVGRLNDDIDTAEQTVEAIYERRVGKIVKMASLAAADMPTEDEGLTDEERHLFDTLVNAIEVNRESVFAILDGDEPVDGPGDFTDVAPETPPAFDRDTTASGESDEETTPSDDDEQPADAHRPADDSTESAVSPDEPPGVGAADLMGSGSDDAGDDSGTDVSGPPSDPESDSPSNGSEDTTEETDGGNDAASSEARTPRGPPSTSDPDEAESDSEGPGDESAQAESVEIDRTTVRITENVGEIFGVDERAYDLSENDVVTLPAPNAGPLLDSDAAERVD